MKRMIVRNRVKDFDHWKRVFDEQAEAGCAAGLELENLWQNAEDANEVFFIFTVADVDRAMAYVSDPASAEVGERAGVVDGELWIVE